MESFSFHQQPSIANYSARFDHRTVTQLHRFAQLTLKSQHKFLKVKQEKQETLLLASNDVTNVRHIAAAIARLLSRAYRLNGREAAEFNSK